jgi:actin
MVDLLEQNPVVVIDNGSDTIKAGISGEGAPRTVFPAIVGRTKSAVDSVGFKSHYIGDEAISKLGILNLSNPISAGIVESWEDMELVWNHTFFNELRIDP